jgi:hypothetical protein
MTQRILGPTGSKKRRRFLLLPVLATAALALFWIAGAQAVHDTGIFQLDRNAQASDTSGASAPLGTHDWDQVCAAVIGAANCSSPAGSAGTSVVSFDTDAHLANGNDASVFTGGGSKDPSDISEWLWKDGSVPDKDDILHGFAARYSAPADPDSPQDPADTACPVNAPATTCELLYFGADRLDASGDSQIGFWFFQNRIQANGADSQGGTKFTGVHKDGDILVLSDFTQGGGTPNIKVLMWNSSTDPTLPGGGTGKCGGNPKDCDNLILLGGGENPADCVGPPQVGDADGFCATVNNDTETAPWSFTNKDGGHNFAPGELYEGGINLSTLPFGVASECFASFSVETRSSADADAVLKDFVLGNFGNCGSGTVTTPKDSSGTDIPAGGITLGVNGSVQVKDHAVVSGTGPSSTDPTGFVTFWLCGPFPDSDTTSNCATGGTQVGTPAGGEALVSTGTLGSQSAVDSDLATISAVGRYCFRANYLGDSNFPASSDPTSATDTSLSECFKVLKRQPSIVTQVGETTPVLLTGTISDQATLSGATSDATGTMTFKLYGPFDASTPASGDTCTDPSGTPPTGGNLVTTLGPIAIGSPNASGNYVVNSGTYVPTAVGRYQWIASYSGDGKNASTSGSCRDANEASVIARAASAISTDPFIFPNDTAAVTASAGGNPTGNVRFRLYDTEAHCTADANTAAGGLLFSETVALASGSASTHNGKTDDSVTDYSTSASTTVWWNVAYLGDTTHFGRNSICLEKTAVTETVDHSGGTAP